MKLLAFVVSVVFLVSTGSALAAGPDLSGTWYRPDGDAFVITSGTSSSIKGTYDDTAGQGYGPVRHVLGKLSGTISSGKGKILVTNITPCPAPVGNALPSCFDTATWVVTGFAKGSAQNAKGGYSSGENMSGFTWKPPYLPPSPFTAAGCLAENQRIIGSCGSWSAFRAGGAATNKRAKAIAACRKLKPSRRAKCVAAAKKRYPS